MIAPASLSHYLHRFAHLRRNKHPVYGAALHKPLLLLALLDEVAHGRVTENRVLLSPEQVERFHLYWQLYTPPPVRKVRLEYPFRHLREDGFWHLLRDGKEAIPEPARTYSLAGLSREFDGARFSDDLWDLMQNAEYRTALRNQVVSSYLAGTLKTVSEDQIAAALSAQIARLKANADGKFRSMVVREGSEDGCYVRHTLCPRVIKALYSDSCAICRLNSHTVRGSGIALCKNHHWGFDAGWFTIADDYSIVVSRQLRASAAYVIPGAEIHLPEDERYRPALDALRWHRDTVFLP